MTTASAFGTLLKRYRTEAGLTQEELAHRAGLATRTISDLERGVSRTGRQDSVRLLADAFGLVGLKRAQFEAAGRGNPGRPLSPAAEWSVAGAPLARTTLVGRDEDVPEISAALGATQVLTLCGPPGVGKTRLALAAAAAAAGSYPDGWRVVSFSGIQDPQMVEFHLAAKLDVADVAPEDMAKALAGALSERRQLLVLDNLEHPGGGGTGPSGVALGPCETGSTAAYHVMACGLVYPDRRSHLPLGAASLCARGEAGLHPVPDARAPGGSRPGICP